MFLLWFLLLMMTTTTSTSTKTTMTMLTSKSAKETFPSLSSSIFFIVISIRSWVQGLTIGVGVIIIKYVIKLSPSPPHLHRPQGPDKNLCQQFQGEFYNQIRKTWLMGFIIKKGKCYDISIEKSNLADHACLQHCQHLLFADKPVDMNCIRIYLTWTLGCTQRQ